MEINPAYTNLNTVQMQHPQAFRERSPYKMQQQGYLTSGITAPPELKSDTVEISSAKNNIETPQKKGMSKGAKWALGIGGTLTTLAAAGVLVMRHDYRKLLKLCKDKIKLSELPEHLEYKATTKEEALKFAKETLGIKEIDETFTDLALHDTLKGIVDVSNANKGKVYIPPKLKFVEMKKGSVEASCNGSVKNDAYGTLYINRSRYDDNSLTEYLQDSLGLSKKSANKVRKKVSENVANKTKKEVGPELDIRWTDRHKDLLTRFIESPENLTLAEKRELYLMLMETSGKGCRLNNPKVFFKYLNHIKEVCDIDIKYDYESILKLSEEKQLKEIARLSAEFKKKTGVALSIKSTLNNPHVAVYHEMGHLQDYTQNLESLILKNSAWSRFKRIFTPRKENKEATQLHYMSRWCKISDFGTDGKASLESSPNMDRKLIKLLFPDLYEHIMNKEIQMTAGEVSEYAKEGVGEFVAEVYARMISGKKIPDNVMKLYKKYNGPLPAAYK